MSLEPLAPLLATRRFLTRETVGDHGRTVHQVRNEDWDAFYRDRYRYDKVVRSTHGVNCTGSCSWNVFVKDGLITWEHQATDYPTTGPDAPDYEPRGCPRGASFSWYEYSPSRVRHPYLRGVLAEMYREARQRLGDPVAAWAEIVETPLKARAYKAQRGRGGFVRASWDEAIEIVAAAHVYTTKTYGPDRVVGFSPIPAMSMASFAAGTRYHALLGGTLLSFYDWYADLPIASPQIWGDQTDVPEAGDWWNATYLMMWGSNIPVTRTPDAHFLAEARYKGTKVVAVSPDYADNVKFADDWLAPHPGTDGALAMAMGHVVLKEFFVDRQTDYFTDYVRRFTDMPFLVTLRNTGKTWAADRFLTAADLGQQDGEHKTVLIDERTGEPVVPNGSLGFRYGEPGHWNLDLGDVIPALGITGDESVVVDLARFDTGDTEGGSTIRRGVPIRWLGGHPVTTVFDLMMAQYGVRRGDLPGDWPTGYDDADAPNTPAWQERITGVPAKLAARIGREFARNAERSRGRSMIVLGAGANQWFHSDMTYRAFISLVTLTGCQGVNGGGWAHYVGQEKARPVTGQQHMSFAFDWQRPMRHQASTPFWYLHTDQWRYERVPADELASPLGTGRFAGMSFADTVAAAQRMGWTPGHPFFNRNPLDLGDEGVEAVIAGLRSGEIKAAAEDPDDPANFPRALTLWRCNLLGSSGKGNEYFMRHLLGVASDATASECEPGQRPRDVTWRDEAPIGKLDLLTTLDFRMTNTGLHSDLVLPAATWYEKNDISTTDMHPFVHAFSPAVEPPSDAHTDYDAFLALADKVSELAVTHLGVRTDVLAAPLQHDTPDELAMPGGRVRDWKFGECEPEPGRTMPKLITVQRDYTQIGRKMRTVGPLLDKLGTTTKAITVDVNDEIAYLKHQNGVIDGRPSLATADRMCEAILALSGTTNGALALKGFEELEKRTGQRFTDYIEGHEKDRITYAETQDAPQPVFTSPEWSGSEKGGRRYSPFTINVERLKPWHTITGRQHFFVEHDWVAELGEQLPAFRPPLNMARHFGKPGDAVDGGVTVRFLTPHAKWSIHSMYHDNELMLALSRGGPVIWMSVQDASKIGVKDNDWIEAHNRNGVVVARAVVSHRMPEGTVFQYHSPERTVNVPKAEKSGKRGGYHNSMTRLLIKPTHLAGGHAQLTYAFNYYGPIGSQRDEITVIRRRMQEVEY
ncbi:putative nitrate reductase alpha subunit [Actinoplanes missouriensis 431]|uniref:nitrate reductase (quinone) n=1 Tax=Actinoplanes missouriensis (strain ATCC 14538 / DSM 43046 / CBS 188.64 / JCM 3121 / NBRC 102363 / NCIMB 12654 / NRRL B-3342 / UNCC 431) TaxID=512565 RepID=I0H894_ACTM4|nr:putative nitrate reductase alpha subunit [Actinoplanes missouriensis 431]